MKETIVGICTTAMPIIPSDMLSLSVASGLCDKEDSMPRHSAKNSKVEYPLERVTKAIRRVPCIDAYDHRRDRSCASCRVAEY